MTATQRVVAGFFIGVWLLLVGLRLSASDTLRAALGIDDLAVSLFIAGISVLIAVLVIGVVQRWRWVFWLVLVACLGGLLRVLASALEMTGIIATSLPRWYVAVQGIIGIAQIVVAAVMIRGYRRLGVWG
jgi:hypothetical protein